jgi:phage baseplate assembly protein W
MSTRTDEQNLLTWWASKTATTEPTLSAFGITAEWWSFSVSPQPASTEPAHKTVVVADADDINQCLRIIAQTPRGADPHRPTFASDVYRYLDRPIPEATPYVVRELISAVKAWEPRVVLNSLQVSQFRPSVSSVSVSASWSIGSLTQETAITIAAR